MNGGVLIAVEVDETRIKWCLDTKYCDVMARSIDEAMAMTKKALEKKEPLSIALLGNAAETHPEFVQRGIIPDIVTDQTSAHDPLEGYIPAGLSLNGERVATLRQQGPCGG